MYFKLLAVLAGALTLSGCMLGDPTKTVRSGIEQILLSTAADHALEKSSLPFLKGKKVLLQEGYFESYDKPYMLAAVRQKILREGGSLISELPVKTDSSLSDEEFYKDIVIVEVASGGIGTDQDDSVVGIPSFPVALPFTTMSVVTPEISIFKRYRQYALAKFIMSCRQGGTNIPAVTTPTLLGASYYTRWDIFMFIKWSYANFPDDIAQAYDIAN